MKQSLSYKREARKKVNLAVLSFSFVAIWIYGRIILVHRISGAELFAGALLSDLFLSASVLCSALLLNRINRSAAAFFLFMYTAFQLINMELAASLDTTFVFSDLRFAFNGYFIKNSFSGILFPGIFIFSLTTISLFVVVLPKVRGKSFYIIAFSIPVFFLAGIFVVPSAENWQKANLTWLSIRDSFETVQKSETSMAEGGEVIDEISIPADQGNPIFDFPESQPRNVLLVVLEGIPGVYLEQVQDFTGVRNPTTMPLFSQIAQKALITPNFVTHNRQTIRGLYSMLTGDFTKLSLVTPKVYEYLSLPEEDRFPALPQILKDSGYQTAYLQAADLAFMSKDRFMPAIGFDSVLGKDFFASEYVPFSWGPDDRAFFEDALGLVGQLDEQDSPWFLTLLTVGTHHPYAVPEELLQQFDDPKAASVAYLDMALGAFIENLRQTGVLEDTLVIITSDESHGVPGQPWGRFWGTNVILAPEIDDEIINDEIFGLVDIPSTVIDYLGIQGNLSASQGRSLFRHYENDRPMFFESFLLETPGVIQRRINANEVRLYRPDQQSLFSSSYTEESVTGEEGRLLSRSILEKQNHVNNSIFNSQLKERRYILLRDVRYPLVPGELSVFSNAQYLDLPAHSRVTVDLELTATGDTDITLYLIEWYEKMDLPPLDIPELSSGDSLSVSFSFYTEQPRNRIWVYLAAESTELMNDEAVSILAPSVVVENFSVRTEEQESSGEYRLDKLEVQAFTAPPFIAHAGGRYSDSTYTNSVEALESNSDKYDLFEIDFSWTQDDILVGLHDWDTIFTRLYKTQRTGAVSYRKFSRITPRIPITPLDLQSLEIFLNENPDKFIVTDIKERNLEGLSLIAETLSDLQNRFIPQIYTPEDLITVKNMGYDRIIWTVYATSYAFDSQAIADWITQWRSDGEKMPWAITMPSESVEDGIAKNLRFSGIPIYTHTVNSLEDWDDLQSLGAHSIYTDNLWTDSNR